MIGLLVTCWKRGCLVGGKCNGRKQKMSPHCLTVSVVHKTPRQIQLFSNNTDEPMWKMQLEKNEC